MALPCRNSILVLLIFLLLPTWCFPEVPKTPCPMQFMDLALRDSGSEFLTPQDRAQIAQLVADQSISDEQRARNLFALNLDARLRLVPEDVAKKVRSIQQSKVRVLPNSSAIDGYYEYDAEKVALLMPPYLQKTMVAYALLAHEFEHAIQDLTLKAAFSPDALIKARLWHMTNYIFLGEAGAMSAEYQYLRLIPTGEKESLIQTIARDNSLSDSQKEIVLRMLDHSSSMNLSDYLISEWDSGRYSRKAIFKQRTLPIKGRISLVAGSAAVTASTFGLITICHSMVKLNGLQAAQSGEFFQKVCTKLTERPDSQRPGKSPSAPLHAGAASR